MLLIPDVVKEDPPIAAFVLEKLVVDVAREVTAPVDGNINT